jgi:mRNA-degrading endonuclease toxin of MazEF toxin-antitoxin module
VAGVGEPASRRAELCRLTGRLITQGGNFARTAGFAVSLKGAGTSTVGVVRCDQPRALDLRARKGRRVESVPGVVMEVVLAKLAVIVGCRGRGG